MYLSYTQKSKKNYGSVWFVAKWFPSWVDKKSAGLLGMLAPFPCNARVLKQLNLWRTLDSGVVAVQALVSATWHLLYMS
jgi:hypothetical protein